MIKALKIEELSEVQHKNITSATKTSEHAPPENVIYLCDEIKCEPIDPETAKKVEKLNKHLSPHIGENVYSCKTYTKKIDKNCQLESHLKTHTQVKHSELKH